MTTKELIYRYNHVNAEEEINVWLYGNPRTVTIIYTGHTVPNNFLKERIATVLYYICASPTFYEYGKSMFDDPNGIPHYHTKEDFLNKILEETAEYFYLVVDEDLNNAQLYLPTLGFGFSLYGGEPCIGYNNFIDHIRKTKEVKKKRLKLEKKEKKWRKKLKKEQKKKKNNKK